MITGETISSGGPANCFDCNRPVDLQVMQSAAGYYIGTACMHKDCSLPDGSAGAGMIGEPHSRETGYYQTKEQAEADLVIWKSGGLVTNVRT